jgi:membrane protein YqaA with SNARE-associated domain
VRPIQAALVFAWGFAEAVIFFVVADVPITLLTARNGFRTGMIASLWATAGALLGGMALYFWACADAAEVDRMLDLVPAISAGQISATKQAMTGGWIAATLIGGFSGNPYKLYAAAAGAQGLSLLPFLAVSLVARLSRFLCSAVLAQALTVVLRRIGQDGWALPLIGLFWTGFYAWYWIRMPW